MSLGEHPSHRAQVLLLIHCSKFPTRSRSRGIWVGFFGRYTDHGGPSARAELRVGRCDCVQWGESGACLCKQWLMGFSIDDGSGWDIDTFVFKAATGQTQRNVQGITTIIAPTPYA